MLEIGKYYQQRNGEVVGPLREYRGRRAAEGFKFCVEAKGVSNRVWQYDGSFLLDSSKQSNYDIVSVVQFTPLRDLTKQPKEEIVIKEFKIEDGKYYKDRGGATHGPMLSNDNEDYPFVDQDCLTYTLYGKYVDGTDHGVDLIEEVPNPCDINPEPIMKNNNPTIEEVLSAIQRGDVVTAEDEDGNRYNIYSNNPISLLLDAKSFEIKVKQPIVKFKYVYQHLSGSVKTTQEYYESDKEFLAIQGDSGDAFEFFEPIQATRKEF